VVSRPFAVDEEFPYLLFFRISKGQILPANSYETAVEPFGKEVKTLNELCIFKNQILYAKC
jgi:hypothetical protein